MSINIPIGIFQQDNEYLLTSYSESNFSANFSIYSGSYTGMGQSFKPTENTKLSSISFYLAKSGTVGNTKIRLYAHTGTYGSTGKPTGAALSEANFDASVLTGSNALYNIKMPSYDMVADTPYCVSIENSGGDSSNYVAVGYDNSSPSYAGNNSVIISSTWSYSTNDMCFYVYAK